MNDYPLPQKTVQLSSYSRQQNASFTTVETRSGKMYFKKMPQNQLITRNISFLLTAYEAQIFYDWFHNILQKGFLPFDIKLATEWDVSQTLRCRFLPDSLLNTNRPNHLHWNYTATILLLNYEPPAYTPQNISEYQNYFNKDARILLDNIANDNLHISKYDHYLNQDARISLDSMVNTQLHKLNKDH